MHRVFQRIKPVDIHARIGKDHRAADIRILRQTHGTGIPYKQCILKKFFRLQLFFRLFVLLRFLRLFRFFCQIRILFCLLLCIRLPGRSFFRRLFVLLFLRFPP